MARTYKRDANGRFAGGGGSARSGRPAAKPVSRGKNRLTRDNAGKITSVGGQGATARGGRLRTAGGKLRATQTAKIKSSGGRLRKPVGGKNPAVAQRPRTEMVVPALQGTKKLAPLSVQRRKIVDRATARQQLLTAQAGSAREALKKASSAAIPARNPYSNLTDRQRKSAETRLAKAQATVAKLDKSLTKVGRARLFASGFAGSTKQGYDRFDNAARRGLIGRQRKPAASAAKPRNPAARVDGDAFAARARRAKGASLRRGINESDRENAMSSAQRRAVSTTKRFAASNQRQAKSDRTAAAAQSFYRNYGSPSTFGQRPRQSTASSPAFGSKKRGRRKP
jgi:hypothetical protein